MKKYLSQTIPEYLLPFYTNNLIYHVAFFAFGNLLFFGTYNNMILLFSILVADYRFFKNYAT